MTLISFWGIGNIDIMSKVQFALPRNDRKYVGVSHQHWAGVCLGPIAFFQKV